MKLVGETHWMNLVSQAGKCLSYMIETERGRTPDNPSEPRLLLHQCKNLGRVIKHQHQAAAPKTPDIKNTVPSKEICDVLVDNYLRAFESIHRVIHIPTFFDNYEEYWSNPVPDSSPFLMLLLLILALGSTLHPEYSETSSLHSKARQWIHSVQQWFSAPIEKSRMNITGIQIQCLLIIAREVLSIDSGLLWISAGSVQRSAMQLGYHRDPKHYPGMSVLHGEMRRRLWATILELGLKESCGMAMAPLISMKHFDTEPPANIDDTEIGLETTTVPASRDITSYTQTSLQVIMLQSFPVRLKLAIIMTDFRTELSYDDVLRLHAELTSVCRNTQSLKIVNTGESLSPLQLNYLDYTLRRPLINLHRPWAVKARTDPRFYFSRKVCLDACLAVTSYASSPDWLRLLTIGNGIWLEICSLAPTSIAFEIIVQLEEKPLNPRAKKTREPLIQILRNASQFKIERLKTSEKNVKGFMFSSMLLGQIEATENGEDIDKAIGEAAISSLQQAHTILKERLSALRGADAACETTPPWDSHDFGSLGDGPNFDGMYDASLDFDFDMLSAGGAGDWDHQSWL